MNHVILGAAILLLTGCSTAESVGHVLRDKQFASYQSTLDQLESDYLQKKMTYADYLQKKKMVEDEYQGKIDGRRNRIQNHNEPNLASEMAL